MPAVISGANEGCLLETLRALISEVLTALNNHVSPPRSLLKSTATVLRLAVHSSQSREVCISTPCIFTVTFNIYFYFLLILKDIFSIEF